MRKLQRVGASALSTMMVLGVGCTTVFASSGSVSTVSTSVSPLTASQQQQSFKLSKDDARKIVTNLFPGILTRNNSLNVTLQTDPTRANRQVYQVDSNPMAENRSGGPHINQNNWFISVDPNTGAILQFQHNGGTWDSKPPIKAAAAQKLAWQWLQKLAPDKADQLVLQPSPDVAKGDYSYLFARKVNGILAPFDGVRIELSASGELVLYTLSWHQAAFPSVPSSMLDKAAGMVKYEQALNLQLHYQRQYLAHGFGPVKLIYTPSVDEQAAVLGAGTPVIDAVTGQALGMDGKPVTTSHTAAPKPLVANGPKQWPVVSKQPLNQGALEQTLRQQFGLQGDDWKLAGSPHSETSSGPFDGHTILNFNFYNQKTQQNVSIGVDSTDGVIMQYSANPASAVGENSLTDTQLQTAADAFVRKLFPNLTGAIARNTTRKVFGPQNRYFASYEFLVNGVPFSNFQVIVNRSTGKIMSYFLNEDLTTKFPPATQAITVQQAKADYLQRDPVELQYMLPEQTASANNPFPLKYATTAKLVYAGAPLPFGTGTLDAIKGTWSQSAMFGSTSSLQLPPDATPVESAVALLQAHGIIASGKTVDTSAIISRAEFVQWLSQAFNMDISATPAPQFPDVSSDSSYAADISTALLQGWLPEKGDFYPSKPLTRLQAADWLVDWMNWDGPAADAKLFKLPFTDVSAVPSNEQGAATIASDEGMIPLIDGQFQPDKQMTVGDAAVALVQSIHTLLGES